MNYTDLWPMISADILAVLQADEFLGARPGVLVEPGDSEDALNRKVTTALGAGSDGKTGIGYLVLPIEKASDENPGIPGGPLKLTLTIQWVENVTLNRGPRGTKYPLRVWAARSEKILKLYTPVLLTQNLVPASPVISEFTPDRDENLRIGQVEFFASEADPSKLQKLNRPTIEVVGDVTVISNGILQINSGSPRITITTAPGDNVDSVWWTIDGSHPWAGRAASADGKIPAIPTSATRYDGNPIIINEPCLFRCRAFKAGTIGSDTAAVNLTSP